MSKSQAPVDFTEGSIIGSILKMGLPSMFGFLTHNIYTLVDTWWVSRLAEGETAVAALTFFGVIIMLLFSFNQLVGPGSVAVISRRYGEKNYWLAEKAIKETLLLKLLFGTLFGVAGFFYVEELLSLVGASGDALRLGVEYGGIMFLSLGALYAMYSIFTALRSVANPHMAMGLMIGANLLNLILDPILIFGYFGVPAMGIRGAAIATVSSSLITLAVGTVIFFSGKANVKLHVVGKESVSIISMWKLIKIGLPAWVGSMSYSGSKVVIAPLIATFGTPVVAAYGVGMQVMSFGIMVIVGIGLGLSSLIGHNVGGQKIERARKTGDQAILLGLGLMVFFGAFVFFFAEMIVGLFFKSPETISHGVTLLKIIALAFPSFGVAITVEEIHMGVGLNSPMMIFDIIYAWGLQVLPILLFTAVFGLGQEVVWWTITISSNVICVVMFVYYRRGRWLTVSV